MPAKGQNCLTCNADCCHGIVGYKYTPEALAKHEAAAKLVVANGDSYYSNKSSMHYSHKELLSFGMVETVLPYSEKGCSRLTPEGKCGLEHHKPRLCRTYWCHGRLWKPQAVGS